MDFIVSLWLSHWHCIIPAAAIVIVMIVQGRGKKKQDDEPVKVEHTDMSDYTG
jgi:hypothetical protein